MTSLVALVADLFFSARIAETAKQLGIPCTVVKDVPAFLAHCRSAAPSMAIIDMNLRSGDASDAVRALRAAELKEQTSRLPVVGYLHDVQEELMTAAKDVGCSLVLSRGRLTRKLPDLLTGKITVTA